MRWWRYVFELVRQLSKRHEIYLAARLEEKELPYLEALKPLCKEIYPYTYRTGGKRGLFDIARLILNYAGFTPVVTTSYGNEGIGAVPGRDLLVADDPGSFAENVIRVLSDEEYAGSLGRNGREFVRKNYAPDAMMSAIESTYEKLVNGKQLNG